jgi:2'-5' RNA ligase
VIAEALRFAADGAGALTMELGDLGAFPSRSRPRILWVGVQAPPALELLQDRIERGCEAIGFPPEGAPFQPHITLGRVREGQRLPMGGLDDHADEFERVSFVGQELVLYESVLTTGGPRYESRLTLDFAR